jgi:hypothetical protein
MATMPATTHPRRLFMEVLDCAEEFETGQNRPGTEAVTTPGEGSKADLLVWGQ